MATYTRNPKVIERRIRGEHILVPLADTDKALDSLYVLNRTASVIWERAAAGLDTAEVVDEVRRMFDVEGDVATDDVSRIISELVSIDALVPAPRQP